MLHALVRRNYGCSHFLVGRDHAGIGKFYKKYDSQKKCLIFQKKIGIKIIPFKEPFLCKHCNVVTNKKCNVCKKENKFFISGSYIRKNLLKKKKISTFLMNEKISKMLNKNSIIK